MGFAQSLSIVPVFSQLILVVSLSVGIVIGIFFYPSRVPVRFRVLIVLLVVVGVALLQANLPVLAGPDEVAFHHNLTELSFNDLLRLARERMDLVSLGIVPSRITFPLYLKILLGGLVDVSERVVVFANVIVWTLASFLWVQAIQNSRVFFRYVSSANLGMLFVLLMTLPSVLYWSSVFSKDISALAFTVIAATSLVWRKYLVALACILVAVALRSYSPLIILAFVGLLTGSYRLLLLGVGVALALLLFLSDGSIVPVLNVPIAVFYSFSSPNPFNIQNWSPLAETSTWVFSPLLLTIEGVLITCFVCIGLILSLLTRINGRIIMLFGLSIILVSSLLIGVGFISQGGEGYVFGTLGDNLVRKKLALWPLIVTVLWVSIITIGRLFVRGLRGRGGDD